MSVTKRRKKQQEIYGWLKGSSSDLNTIMHLA